MGCAIRPESTAWGHKPGRGEASSQAVGDWEVNQAIHTDVCLPHQGMANLFRKGQKAKYFRLYRQQRASVSYCVCLSYIHLKIQKSVLTRRPYTKAMSRLWLTGLVCGPLWKTDKTFSHVRYHLVMAKIGCISLWPSQASSSFCSQSHIIIRALYLRLKFPLLKWKL